jgi:ABC-type polysaccharide/polyol phosphate export permease
VSDDQMTTPTRGIDAASILGFPPRRYLQLLWSWTKRNFSSTYQRSALRTVWAVLQPFFFVAVYVLIFGVIFKASGGDLPYLSYLLAGVVVFRVVAAGMSANTCLVDNAALIGHSYFPREIIPFATVLGSVLDLMVTITALVVVAVVQGVVPGLKIVALPLVLLSILMFSAAVCVFVSTIQVFVRDFQFVVTFILQGLFFASPISYEPSQLPSWLRWLLTVNPLSVDCEALRDVVLRNVWPGWRLFGLHFVIAAALLVGAVAHLRSVQHRIIDLA